MVSRNGALLRNITVFVLLLPFAGFAQAPADPSVYGPAPAPAPLLSPEQLDDLVAPVALYPDPLLGQVLAASTYPLEIVQAQQWLSQNRNLTGAQLMDAARQQNWDASVQALVAFPQAMQLLSGNVRWTTDLGNAFLAQQADVMAAVQRMRARAQANGRLQSTPQQVVTDDTEGGQQAIEIQPANPQVIYVPTYDPAYVWGAGAYPELWYPDLVGWGFGFGPAIYLGGFFPGWLGWGGWGWGCGWFGHSLFVNAGFFNHFGFRGFNGFAGRGFGGHDIWAHNPIHRGGVPYPNRAVATRFNSTRFAGSTAGRSFAGNGGWNRFGNTGSFSGSRYSNNAGSSFRGTPNSAGQGFGRGFSSSPNAGARYSNPGYSGSRYGTPGMSRSYAAPNTRSYAAPNYNRSYAAPNYNRSYAAPNYNRSYAAPNYNRSYAAPNYSRSYAAPRSYSAPAPRSFSAPARSFSAPSRSFSAPHYSGGGGFSGGHSFSGGGGHSGGFSGGGGHSGGGGGHRR